MKSTVSFTSNRSGAFLLEVAVACALVAVLLGVFLRVLGVAAAERRNVEYRAIALQQAAGALERARSIPWDEISIERLEAIELPSSIERVLPGAALQWSVTAIEEPVPHKQVQVVLDWHASDGAPQMPARLSDWLYETAPGAAENTP